MKKILYIALGFLLTFVARSQTISGRVVSEETQSKLAAVNISFEIGAVKSKANPDNQDKINVTETIKSEKGYATGTLAVTDQNGEYLINIPNGATHIVFSLPNYATQKIELLGQHEINVELKLSRSLDEVIINVGYGTIKKQNMVGAASAISASDVQDIPVPTIDQALQGRVSGLNVSLGDGQPGSTPDIVIRGGNSITGSNSPLWVIDGFPTEDPTGLLDPANVESVDVLKDASSTAIYGARGANGVIVVTTKKTKEGRPTIKYDGYVGFQSVTRTLPVLSPYEYVKLASEILPAIQQTFLTTYGATSIDYFKDVPSVDWQSEAFQNGVMQRHSINVGGGTSGTKYQLGISYFNQQGIIRNTGYDQVQTNMRVDQKIGKYINMGLKATHTYQNSFGLSASNVGTNSYTNSVIYSLLSYAPISAFNPNIEDFQNEIIDDASISNADYRVNPLINIQNAYRTTPTNIVNANAYVEIKPIPNLTIKSTVNMYYRTITQNIFNNTLVAPNIITRVQGINGSYRNTQDLNITNENTINYNLKHTIHEFDFLAGASFMRGDNWQKGYTSNNIPANYEALGVNALRFGSLSSGISSQSVWLQNSFFARVSYNLMKRYLITATMRADGSSRFPSNNLWGYFPSVGIGWRVDQESFWKSISEVWNVFKVRASWGVTGNNRITDFPYQQLISSVYANGLIRYPFNGTSDIVGSYVSTVYNPNLKWETTEQYNAGVDLEFFKSRIALTMDYYFKNTYDLLLNAQVPASTGFSSVVQNIGSVQNQGFEFSFTTQNIVLPIFTWSTNFNISFNRNKVTGLSNNQQYMTIQVPWETSMNNSPAYAVIVGQPLGLMYGYVYDGIYRLSDFTNGVLNPDVASFGTDRSQIQPGQAKYKDIDGNKIINDNDLVTIGNALPIHTGGFTNNFSVNLKEWGTIDLSVFFQWSYGNDILNANKLILERMTSYSANQLASTANRWTLENDATATLYKAGTNNNGFLYSSRVVEDGSYLRLKNITIGYSFSKKVLDKIKLKQIRLYVSANNLYTWTKYTGYDPEVSVRLGSLTQALMPGFDYSAYPRALSVIFGLNVTF